ncbi:MAG: CRISPR-associated endonuclease Cas2 [Candidatus Margulisbacteria bacterium]|nr:CRISPR-associated endonuclease Cas2 [Candidatus Margulisiibacteriota bacterium]
MLTWFIYDVTSNKVRNKIIKDAKGYGFYRVQKSVFLGEADKSDVDALKEYCSEIIDHSTDSVYVFPVCEECFSKARFVGQAFNKELVCDELKSFII